jgi:hypothetical protein
MGAIVERFPSANVNVHFIAKAPGSSDSTSPVPHIKNIIAVASGKGGVGKSTVAVNLAYGLQKLGAKVGLMDADVYGPSLPTMLGLVGKRPLIQEVTGQMKMVPLDAHGIPVISIGNIIEADQAVVLRGPRLAAIIKQFFNDVIWEELDFLVDAVANETSVLGARMMGGGFGGCSINLVEKGSEKELIQKIAEQYRSQFGIELKAYKVKISKGTTEYKVKI